MSEVVRKPDPKGGRIWREDHYTFNSFHRAVDRMLEEKRWQWTTTVEQDADGQGFLCVCYPMTKDEWDGLMFDQADLQPDPPPRAA